MLSVARTGDPTIGVCTGHSPPITVSGTVLAKQSLTSAFGLPIARVSDLVIASCGHTGIIVSGSPTVFVGGLPAARMTDRFTGTYTGTILNGASNIMSL